MSSVCLLPKWRRPSSRRAEAGGAGKKKMDDVFHRKTIKYVVPLNQIDTFSESLSKFIPLSPFKFADGTSVDTEMVSSVYYDTKGLDLYKGRVDKEHKAELLRIRWYGPFLRHCEHVYVERKRHYDFMGTGKLSNKKRFALPLKEVAAYLSGALEVGETSVELEKENLAYKIQAKVISQQLSPVIRTEYERTSYWDPSSVDGIRVTVDTACRTYQEHATWQEVMNASGLPRHPPADLGMAVVEVKIPCVPGESPCLPPWMDNLLALVEAIPLKVSKYQFGCISFYPDLAYPHGLWVSEYEALRSSWPVDTSTISVPEESGSNGLPAASHQRLTGLSRKSSRGTQRSTQARASARGKSAKSWGPAPLGYGDGDLPEPEAVDSKRQRRVLGNVRAALRYLDPLKGPRRDGFDYDRFGKVEPKCFMSNERTMINYFQTAWNIFAFCVGLIHIASFHDIIPVVIALTALADSIIIYAAVLFHMRRSFMASVVRARRGLVPWYFNESFYILCITLAMLVSYNGYIMFLIIERPEGFLELSI